jgi:hypothetical protein
VSKRKARAHHDGPVAARDADLAAWCTQMGLQPNGQPLSGMDASMRAHDQQIADERAQAEQPKYKTPFWRLPYTSDL